MVCESPDAVELTWQAPSAPSCAQAEEATPPAVTQASFCVWMSSRLLGISTQVLSVPEPNVHAAVPSVPPPPQDAMVERRNALTRRNGFTATMIGH